MLIGILLLQTYAEAQRTLEIDRQAGGRRGTGYDSQGRPAPNRKSSGDSLQKRDKYADSITIFYKYYDSSAIRTLDSSINDFAKKFAQPYYYQNNGNYGTAARSLLFNPLMKAGWDAGFHQFDIYDYTIENTKFFQTTRPYTELAYILGSKAEQTINVLHTQNKKSNFNFALAYRFINSPGSYKTQNNNHNNIRFNAAYHTNNRKYAAMLIWVSNKHVSSENGGLRDASFLDSLSFNNPFQLETRLGASGAFSQNPFNTNISTGNMYKNSTILFRHYFDIGKKDSVFNQQDSVYNKIFYARFRLQHIFKLRNYHYTFIDKNVVDSNYQKYLGLSLPNNDNISLKNKWNIVENELSIITFPDKNNQAQFLKAGTVIQNIKETSSDTITHNNYNLSLTAEYRNRTKNNVWDIEANSHLYLAGLNSGDYAIMATLKRTLSKKFGYLALGFQNVNRTPSAIFELGNFMVKPNNISNKENTIRLFAGYENPIKNFSLSAEYFLVNNYTYFDSMFSAKQESTLFNVIHIAATKKIALAKHINWYAELHVQQATANAPINLPLILTRNRFAFEGNFFTNLFLSTGLELRYYTNYKPSGYSPLTGQFFYQNSYSVANRPEINLFLNFRIKSFKAYMRLENLNTLIPGKGKYNFVSQNYAANGLWFRTGIWWNFVN
ncbi:MAG: hypothetical protein KIT64_07540 [Chitinophagaceae bacterium]|nr:hypothetical protein [Chitinophagaceae bacterium]